MTIEGLLFLFISIAVLVIKPGPSMVALVTRALQAGFFPAFGIALGLASMHFIYFPLAALSFSLEGEMVEKLAFFLQLAGATYIIWIGIKGLRNIERNPWDKRIEDKRASAWFDNITTGVAISLSNPYIILFYVGLIPTIFDFKAFGLLDIALATFSTFIIVLSFLSLKCALASQMREILRDYKFVRGLNLGSSLVMLGIGVFIILNALGLLQVSLG